MESILVYGMTDNPGGIESYLISLFSAFEGEIQLDFVTDFEEIAHRELLEKYGSKIYHIPAKSKGVWAHIKAFRKILKKNPQYKAVYFNILDSGAAITQLAPFLSRRKIVTHSHNANTDKPKLHKICKPLLKITSGTKIACSEAAAKYMFGKTKNVKIIKNAIDAKKFRYDAKKTEVAKKELQLENKNVICHVGRLTYQKNPFVLLDIFKKTLELCPDAILLSIGTGDLEEKVISYSKELGIEENVRFMGRYNNIPQILAASDAFLLPSLYEGLPIVAIEAQAAGLTSLLSDKITRETDITGNVIFKSLNDDYEDWARVLIEITKKERTDTFNQIYMAGYDVSSREENIAALKKILIEK